MSKCDARTSAVAALAQVLEGASLDQVLAPLARHRDRNLIFEICFGVLRHWYSLNEALDRTLDQPKKLRNALVRCVLLSGLYQLAHTRVPAYAAISESVEAARALNRAWASGLINATLRNCVLDGTPASSEARHEAPAWLIRDFQAQYPERWEALFRVLNTRAPMTLRVNARRGTVDDFLAKFELPCQFRRGVGDHCLTLEVAHPKTQIPGYEEGWVSIQDEASQAAVPLLGIQTGDRVLDACAAPGIKTLQIVEQNPDVRLVSIDRNPARFRWLGREVERLGLQAGIRRGDATCLDWWNREPFDRVLVDAPCSATGAIRRHPDIKIHRTPGQVRSSARTQLAILRSVWGALKVDGSLLYSTCSILNIENSGVMERFVGEHDDAELMPISLGLGESAQMGHLALPLEGGHDGFYYCLLRKTGARK